MQTTFRYFLILLVLLSGMTLSSCKKQFHAIPQLSEYVEQDNYGALYDEIVTNRSHYKESDLLFYDIILQSMLNRPEESNTLIARFRKKFISTDSTEYLLTHTEYKNYVKLDDYKKLKEIGGRLIDNYKAFIDSIDFVELKDDHRIYTLIENEPSIVVKKQADTEMKITKDLAGYTLMTVKASNDSSIDFIFDTGANVNVLTESSAKKFNLRILQNSDIYVMGATGMRNHARIGFADSLTIGNVEIRNAEFVVFADSLLTFANGIYKINGVVGFPIFSRFEEITYTDTMLYIPEVPTLTEGEPNMFIEADDYILSIGYKGKKYPFFFDTGNDKTFFKRNFYDIDSLTYSDLPDTLFGLGGVGEVVTMKAKVPETVRLDFAGKEFTLVKPFVETEYETMNRYLYGSIGKDFMYLYPKRIMSFRQARLAFE